MRDDSGNAVIEFLLLGLLILIPLMLAAASISVIYAAETAVSAGVREAARAYSLHESDMSGRITGQEAGAIAVADFGIANRPTFKFTCVVRCTGMASQVQVWGAVTVQVPFLSIDHTATATHVVTVRHP